MMKKTGILLLLCLILSGCAEQKMIETVNDSYDVPAAAQMYRIQVTLPQDAAVLAMGNSDDSMLYMCDGYTVTTHLMEGGNMDRTFRQVTGFTRDAVSAIMTVKEDVKRFDCVWSAAGEGEEQVYRAVILDDGLQHYAVTLATPASKAGELIETWEEILNSVMLVSTG